MQGLELVGIFTLAAVAVALLRHRLARLDEAPLVIRLAFGAAVGAVLTVPIVIRSTNLIPDELESLALAGVVVALIGVVALLRS
jgi:hypothetical protein